MHKAPRQLEETVGMIADEQDPRGVLISPLSLHKSITIVLAWFAFCLPMPFRLGFLYASLDARKMMGPVRDVSWVAPTIVISGLAAGFLFAIGHHLFYARLNGRVPPEDSHSLFSGFVLSKQEINIAAGTVFAFLVKSSLRAADSAAYIQLLWRAIRKRRAAGVILGDFDSILSALYSPISLLRLPAWRPYPLLFAVAVVTW